MDTHVRKMSMEMRQQQKACNRMVVFWQKAKWSFVQETQVTGEVGVLKEKYGMYGKEIGSFVQHRT